LLVTGRTHHDHDPIFFYIKLKVREENGKRSIVKKEIITPFVLFYFYRKKREQNPKTELFRKDA